MPITLQQIQIAEAQQTNAATDPNQQVRLIAGPGTGKSAVIEKRVLWLLENQIAPSNVFVISFTRASSRDLESRIRSYCRDHNNPAGGEVSVSTLHSLALRTLRVAHLLSYPGIPSILDDWELKNIIDKEFSSYSGYRSNQSHQGYSPSRCEEIREEYEAFCGTGSINPPNFIPPIPPISIQEREQYRSFHQIRTHLYSCLLPGEIVQQCLEYMNSGVLNPGNILGIHHLIIDEYQDLNPVDIEFIDFLTNNGVNTFIAGDDDQSIYSFRFASPLGIQQYHNRFPEISDHTLDNCFRCTPSVIEAAQPILNNYHDNLRLFKDLFSLYENSNPPISGQVYRWQFQNGDIEARSIARSISLLLTQGIDPKDIMILLSNSLIQLPPLIRELTLEGIPFESPREISFFDTEPGRFIMGILRIVCQHEDYFAYRLILGTRPHIGPTTCNTIASLITSNNLNYKNIFCSTLPNDVFPRRLLNEINKARAIYDLISNWNPDDTIGLRRLEVTSILQNIFNQEVVQKWEDFLTNFNQETNLREILDYINADNLEQKENILFRINFRLQSSQSEVIERTNRVQILTMHGAKGLSAKVVFIPGLENEILPGSRRIPYTGLVNEAARMLYVSITRARAASIISFANSRYYYGSNKNQAPSQFVRYLNGRFVYRISGLTNHEVEEIIETCNNL